MPLTEVKAAIPPSAVDAVDDFLLESELASWNVLEDVIVKSAWVMGIFSSAEEARLAWEDLAARIPGAPLGVPEFKPLTDADWRDSYKAHFHPWQFGRLHWVPVWERNRFECFRLNMPFSGLIRA